MTAPALVLQISDTSRARKSSAENTPVYAPVIRATNASDGLPDPKLVPRRSGTSGPSPAGDDWEESVSMGASPD